MYHSVVVAGVAFSLLFSELTGLSPAGLVVPGYIALSMQNPERILYTLVISFASWGIAKGISCWTILYGRRRFAVLILLSYILNELMLWLFPLSYLPGIIGVLVPGIIANEIEKQGIIKSMLSLAIVVALLLLLMMWWGMRCFPV